MLMAGTFFTKMVLKKAFPYFLYVLKTMKLFLSQVSSGTYVSYRQLDISFILR
jgi:hypothetical protein